MILTCCARSNDHLLYLWISTPAPHVSWSCTSCVRAISHMIANQLMYMSRTHMYVSWSRTSCVRHVWVRDIYMSWLAALSPSLALSTSRQVVHHVWDSSDFTELSRTWCISSPSYLTHDVEFTSCICHELRQSTYVHVTNSHVSSVYLMYVEVWAISHVMYLFTELSHTWRILTLPHELTSMSRESRQLTHVYVTNSANQLMYMSRTHMYLESTACMLNLPHTSCVR